MAFVRQSRNGTEYQNVFCKEQERTGRNGEVYTNYVGYATVGNKVIKISLQPEPKQNRKGENGYYVTVVATKFKPNNMGRMSGGGARF